MRQANTSLTSTILRFCAVLEISVGVAILAMPELAVRLLLGGQATALTEQTARVAGISMLALGLACWPDRPRGEAMPSVGRAMLTFNALLALYFVAVHFIDRAGGVLLWPAIVLHGGIAVLLLSTLRRDRRQD